MKNIKSMITILLTVMIIIGVAPSSFAAEPYEREPGTQSAPAPGTRSGSSDATNTRQRNAAQKHFKSYSWSKVADDYNGERFPGIISDSEWKTANANSKKMGLAGASKYDAAYFVCNVEKAKISGYVDEYQIILFAQTSSASPDKVCFAGIKVVVDFTDETEGSEASLNKSWIFASNTRRSTIENTIKSHYQKNVRSRPQNLREGVYWGGAYVPKELNQELTNAVRSMRTALPSLRFVKGKSYYLPAEKLALVKETLERTNQVNSTNEVFDMGGEFYYSEHLYSSKDKRVQFYVDFCIARHEQELFVWIIAKPVVTNSKNWSEYFIYPIDVSLNTIANDMKEYVLAK